MSDKAETWDDPEWGDYGESGPCKHLLALRDFMKENWLDIWSEHGVEPDGWVNIGCGQCCRTYEAVLSDRNAEDY